MLQVPSAVSFTRADVPNSVPRMGKALQPLSHLESLSNSKI